MSTTISDHVVSAAETAPPQRSFASWWRGRFGARMVTEIALCGALLMVYRGIRVFTQGDSRTAYLNSREILRFESWLGMPFEDDIQQFLLNHPDLIRFLNHYYVLFHFPAAIALLLWLYLRHPARYLGFRNLMAFVTFAALVIHLVYPLAPPRMMSGFVDTMREFGPNIYPKNSLAGAANQIAAMPSLHFGWAMIEALAVISVLTSRWRYVIVVHPALMALAIIATANHWWIDAAAAALIIVGAVAVWRLVARSVAAAVPGDLGVLQSVAPNVEPSNVSSVANDDTGRLDNRFG